jgi:CubicO group peptidase (beta-lactamase class C family)
MTPLPDLLRAGVAEGVFPGAAFAVGNDSGTWFGYVGRQTYAQDSPAVDEQTLWDLASVTKIAATTPAAMLLVQDGLLDLDQHIGDICPEFTHKSIKIRDLLLHRSGLPAYATVTELRSRAEVWTHICGLPLACEPGASFVYSCLGFVSLQHALERVSGSPMDAFLRARLYAPLGMDRTMFNPVGGLRPHCAPTEALPSWQRELEDSRGFQRVQDDYVQGDVHDPVACVMGGVSGNAGLFSTPVDLAAYLRALLDVSGKVFGPDSVAYWTKEAVPGSAHALGWQTKSPEGSSAGSFFSPASFGHTGYTGTSVWVDPENRVFVALLANRVHPSCENLKIGDFRPRFHDAAFQELLRLR